MLTDKENVGVPIQIFMKNYTIKIYYTQFINYFIFYAQSFILAVTCIIFIGKESKETYFIVFFKNSLKILKYLSR